MSTSERQTKKSILVKQKEIGISYKKVSNAAEHLILQNDGFVVVAVVVKRRY